MCVYTSYIYNVYNIYIYIYIYNVSHFGSSLTNPSACRWGCRAWGKTVKSGLKLLRVCFCSCPHCVSSAYGWCLCQRVVRRCRTAGLSLAEPIVLNELSVLAMRPLFSDRMSTNHRPLAFYGIVVIAMMTSAMHRSFVGPTPLMMTSTQ